MILNFWSWTPVRLMVHASFLCNCRQEYGERILPCISNRTRANRMPSTAGFASASGEIFGWLNSDDRMRPGAMAKVVDWLDSPEPRWLYGRAGMIDETGTPCSSLIVRYKNWRGRKFSRLKLLTENFIPQMAVFWNRAMWERAGGLDNDRHLDMDYDLWLRFAEVSEPLVLKDVLADFRIHGEAKGSRQTGAQLEAAFATAKKHSEGMGWMGKLALLVHKLFSMRTRLLYRLMKPK